jgi:ABC-type transport system substrate-binding protein
MAEEALRLQQTDPAAANSAWTDLDHQIVEEAIVAPVDNQVSTFAVSARVGNVQVHPRWGILLSRLWVQ